MTIKDKMIRKYAEKLGYDITNPRSVMKKTITDTVITSRTFMKDSEIIDFLKETIRKIEENEIE